MRLREICKFIFILPVAASHVTAGAQEWGGGWEAEYNQHSCFLTTYRIAQKLTYVPGQMDPVEYAEYDPALESVTLGFATVIDAERNPFFVDDYEPAEVGSLVFWLTFPPDADSIFLDESDVADFSPVKDVWVDGSSATRLRELPESAFREFILKGEKVQDIWSQLYEGGHFIIEAQKEDDSTGSFEVADIPTANFRLRADQFDACVLAMTRDLEMHRALPDPYEEL